MRTALIRTRWAAVGAAVAVALGAGGGISWFAHADSAPSTFVGITPCRLFDTRAGSVVGDRAAPLQAGETFARQVWGTNGACTIPSSATGISYNLTVPDPTVTGFIKLFPGDAAEPHASAINPIAAGGTKANSGIVGLSATGGIAFVTQSGPVDLLLDITGYFTPGSGGAQGPQGLPGADGARGLSAWDTIPSGQTVTGNFSITEQYEQAATASFGVQLPAKAPVALTAGDVNFSPDVLVVTSDDDPTCTGTPSSPTAPAGKVCLYIDQSSVPLSVTNVRGDKAFRLADQAFYVSFNVAAGAGSTLRLFLTWAYTAP